MDGWKDGWMDGWRWRKRRKDGLKGQRERYHLFTTGIVDPRRFELTK